MKTRNAEDQIWTTTNREQHLTTAQCQIIEAGTDLPRTTTETWPGTTATGQAITHTGARSSLSTKMAIGTEIKLIGITADIYSPDPIT